MAVKEKRTDSTEEFEWSVENQIQLFFAMNGHKPVGINKYFHMVCIWEKFRTAIKKDISLKSIWDYLESLYGLVALDDTADLPFPSIETEFNLPESEFMELMKNKQKDDVDNKLKDQKDKTKEPKKEKDIVKETPKRETITKEVKTPKEAEKKKDESKKVNKELEVKKEKQKEVKDIKKDVKTPKGRTPKSREELEEALPGSSAKKDKKDTDLSRETAKRAAKRPTRQSTDSRASFSPRDTPPPKRRRL